MAEHNRVLALSAEQREQIEINWWERLWREAHRHLPRQVPSYVKGRSNRTGTEAGATGSFARHFRGAGLGAGSCFRLRYCETLAVFWPASFQPMIPSDITLTFL